MTATAPTLNSRWVESNTNSVRSYGIALCVAIAFLLLLPGRATQYVRVLPETLSAAAVEVMQRVRVIQEPSSGGKQGGGKPGVSGEIGKPKVVMQLVVPHEVDVPPTEPTDWTEDPGGSLNNDNPGGDGLGNNPDSHGTDTGNAPHGVSDSDTPDPDEEFVAVEHEPTFSMDDLRRAVRYPDVAVRMQIEGRVIVRAYINADGSIGSASVVSSDNEMLNEAALSGVRKLQCKAAIQNGKTVGCWIHIPVSFELKN